MSNNTNAYAYHLQNHRCPLPHTAAITLKRQLHRHWKRHDTNRGNSPPERTSGNFLREFSRGHLFSHFLGRIWDIGRRNRGFFTWFYQVQITKCVRDPWWRRSVALRRAYCVKAKLIICNGCIFTDWSRSFLLHECIWNCRLGLLWVTLLSASVFLFVFLACFSVSQPKSQWFFLTSATGPSRAKDGTHPSTSIKGYNLAVAPSQ